MGAASEIGGTNGHCREARELTWDIPGLSMHESHDNFPILPDPRLNAPGPIRDARVTLPTESDQKLEARLFMSAQRPFYNLMTNVKNLYQHTVIQVLSDFLSFSTTTL